MSDEDDQDVCDGDEHGWDAPDPLERAAIDAVFGGEGAADGASAHELRALRAACRDALDGLAARGGADPSETLRAARIANRVLARTTREDLRRRGDVGLLVDFVADRLRDSALLRFAAALLLVQLTIVPLVAWHVLREPPLEGFRSGIEPRPEDPFEAPPAEERLVELEGSAWEEDLDARLARLRLEEDLADVRPDLERIARALRGVEPTTALGRDLARLGGGGLGVPTVDGPTTFAGALVRVEAALHGLGRGGAGRGLSEALEALTERAAAPDAAPGEVELASRAFAHADVLGVALPARAEALAWAAGGRGGRAWLRALADLVSGAAGDDPYAAAWVDAVREL